MQVLPEIVAALCREHAADLVTPPKWEALPPDKVKLLWGIAGVESSFGLNSNPRHEPGYCRGGRYFNPSATSEWGCLAHCSYGPWQVMFPNFSPMISPLSLVWESDPRVAAKLCLLAAINLLNRALLRGARDFGDIVIAYNGPDNEAEYSARLAECCDRPLPVAPDGLTA